MEPGTWLLPSRDKAHKNTSVHTDSPASSVRRRNWLKSHELILNALIILLSSKYILFFIVRHLLMKNTMPALLDINKVMFDWPTIGH